MSSTPSLSSVSPTSSMSLGLDRRTGVGHTGRTAPPSARPRVRPAALCATLCATLAIIGCSASPPVIDEPAPPPPDPRALVMLDGRTGEPLDWTDLLRRTRNVDAIFLGENHDDALGHAFQRAFVEDLAAIDPSLAVCLEMFERDEQSTLDAWARGEIDDDVLVERTGAASWPDWSANYQPVIDAARASGARLVAANAPRRFVRTATSEGYEPLRELPVEDRALFDLPAELDRGPYRERLRTLMSDSRGGATITDDQVDAALRPQMVWDATMGRSVARALDRGARRAVLLVGGFHVEFDGGTVLETRRNRPGARTLVIRMLPEHVTSLRPSDRGIADVIVFTVAPE